MTPEQEAHLSSIIAKATHDIDAKYRRGQQEHGGDLWRQPGLLKMAIEEAIDQVVYLYTLQDDLVKKGLL